MQKGLLCHDIIHELTVFLSTHPLTCMSSWLIPLQKGLHIPSTQSPICSVFDPTGLCLQRGQDTLWIRNGGQHSIPLFFVDWPLSAYLCGRIYFVLMMRMRMRRGGGGGGTCQGLALKLTFYQFEKFFITGCTESCQSDNFRYSQWWKFCQYDNISVSVKMMCVYTWW